MPYTTLGFAQAPAAKVLPAGALRAPSARLSSALPAMRMQSNPVNANSRNDKLSLNQSIKYDMSQKILDVRNESINGIPLRAQNQNNMTQIS